MVDQSKVAHTCTVGTRDKQVVLEFGQDVSYVTFTPDIAKKVGEAIAKEAYYLETGLRPQDASIIADRKRNIIITRIIRIMTSMERKKHTPQVIAKHIADSILSELY